MCKIVEDYANNAVKEAAIDSIKNLFINGCVLDAVIASFANISEDVIRKIYVEVAGSKTLA